MARIFSVALVLICCFSPSLNTSDYDTMKTNLDGFKNLEGTVIEVSEDRAFVAVSDNELVRRMAFSLEENRPGDSGVAAGDRVTILYAGPLLPDYAGNTDVRSWGLAKKEMNGILRSLDENQVVVQPMPDDPLAGQVEELMFLRDNEDLKKDIGVRAGEPVSVTYVRDVIPGNPPQIEAKSWHTYVDLHTRGKEIVKHLEEP